MILMYGSTYINMLNKDRVSNSGKFLKRTVKNPGKAVITTELLVTLLEFIISGIIVEKYGMHLISNLANKYSDITFNAIKYLTIVILTIIATYITMIIGIYIPKHLVLTRKNKKINKLAIYLFGITSLILSPLSFIATIFDDSYRKRKDKTQNALYKAEEIKHFTNVEYHKGSINKTEKEIMEKVALSFNVKIAKIMTPIEKMSYIKINYSLSTIMSVFRRSTYSRLLVYDDSKTNIIGALYVKDTLNHYDKIKSGKIKLESLLRIPLEVSSEDTAYKVYMKMRKHKMHLGVVKNKDGEIVGILTLDDILEEILGKIEDEYEHKN
jgi:CBS domain containing-hemolysin-like protein